MMPGNPVDSWVMKLNERIAIRGTLIFGTMWVTYLFFIYGFLPLIFPGQMDKFLYWSNTIQLWSLPLLMVGTNLLGRASEKRSKETHDAVMRELKIIMEEHKELKKILKEVCK
jgi:hypothetical protein